MALEWEVSEFKRFFPTCPICGSDLGYDATRESLTYYVRCKSCVAVWKLIVEGPVWKMERRYLLVEPDKDMLARSLVGKSEKWHKEGYKVEFWKSLDLRGLKKAEATAPSRPPLTDLEEEVLDYMDKHGGEISIPKASEELGLSEARLMATINKLKEKTYIE
jgi:hypothetical protein